MIRKQKSINSKRQPRWEREEVVLLVSEYFRTKRLSHIEQENSIEMISKVLKKRSVKLNTLIDKQTRNVVGIRMKFGNIKSLDPEMAKQGHTGLRNSSKLDREIVKQYFEQPDQIIHEANAMFMYYMGCSIGEYNNSRY